MTSQHMYSSRKSEASTSPSMAAENSDSTAKYQPTRSSRCM